jgi:hypothetical protein
MGFHGEVAGRFAAVLSFLLFQRNSPLGGNVREGGVMAFLQDPDVRGNGPSIGRLDALRVRIHHTVTLGYYVKKMSHWSLPEAVDVIRRRGWIATLNNHSVPLAGPAMARRAVDLKTLPAALQSFTRNSDRKNVNQVGADLALVKCRIGIEVAPGNRVSGQWTRSHLVIAKKIVLRQRLAIWLLKHIATTADDG